MAFDIRKIERDARALWRRLDLLKLIEERNRGGARFFLLDGPPYANYIPHVGHVRNTVYKDLYIRHAMMQGKRVLFQPGFDTHGLPIENMVEKQLSITSKKEIEELGIEEFTRKCKESAALNKDLWLDVYERLGSWYSWKEPYLSYDNSYIESAWWAFARIWEKGLVYEGTRPVHWCPRCQTSLAGYEVTDSYKIVSDPGVYVKFKVRSEDDLYLLAFTTTPWTLPSNVALALNPREAYVKAKTAKGTLILAKALVSLLDRIELPYEIIEEFKGSALEGLRYEPLIECPQQDELKRGDAGHRVVMSISLLKERVASKVSGKKGLEKKDLFEEFVTVDTGTGIVHTAPGHGHTDNAVGKHYGLPALSPLDEAARFTQDAGKYAGMQVREANHLIAEDLHKEGKLLHYEKIEHSYPLCWRCKTPLIFRLSRQWFISIETLKEELLEDAGAVEWQPGFAGERMQSWIANASDWNFSRQRYWGIPIPIWVCECGKRRVIASAKDLRSAALEEIPESIDLHTAGVYTIECECGARMKKIPDIFDVWYDAGCASFASLGYPFKNKELLEQHYPVSRINESQDQIRGWFYHLLVMGRLAFDAKPVECISMPGWVVDEQGEKMSKSKGNVTHAKDAIEQFGADPLRFYYCWDIAPHQLQKFSKATISSEIIKLFTILWNLASLAEQWDRSEGPEQAEERWLLSRKHSALRAYFDGIESFELHEGCRRLYDFVVNDVSRTYVQFTRGRDDGTPGRLLRETLLDLARSLAPVTPHLSEAIYLRLKHPEQPESVHLAGYPTIGETDGRIEEEFAAVQDIIQGVLAARDKAQIGVRWPIKEIRAFGEERYLRAIERHKELILLKVNAKAASAEPLDLRAELQPDYAQLGRTLGKETAAFLESFEKLREGVLGAIDKGEPYRWGQHELSEHHFKITRHAPAGWQCVPAGKGEACILLERTPELDREGYAREFTRRIQQLRKEAGLEKSQRIRVCASMPEHLLREAVAVHEEEIAEKVGAERIDFESDPLALSHHESGRIKGAEYVLGLSLA